MKSEKFARNSFNSQIQERRSVGKIKKGEEETFSAFSMISAWINPYNEKVCTTWTLIINDVLFSSVMRTGKINFHDDYSKMKLKIKREI